MLIVSANYRDRTSKYRWLIRDESQDPRQARAFKAIDATGVAFCPSTQWESGFGCSTVAFCETAVGYGPMVTAVDDEPLSHLPALIDNSVPLHFNGRSFFIDKPDEGTAWVPTCANLRLNSDGSMHAVIEAAVEKPRRRSTGSTKRSPQVAEA